MVESLAPQTQPSFAPGTAGAFAAPSKISFKSVSYSYGEHEALHEVDLEIPPNAITSIFGPAGSGKTTLMRLVNRLNDLVDGTRLRGTILLEGQNIYDQGISVTNLRRRVGMVFALPLPLPGTVRQNVLYGPLLAGTRDDSILEEKLQRSLSQAALWDEVKDRLGDPATSLSGGQQQRLCIARSLALEPDVILLDEPTSGLDPISTAKVEESLYLLKQTYTIVIVPHSVQQAARVSDWAAFLLMGDLVEAGLGSKVFTAPSDKRTEDYVTGRFG
jgi:phosphate transport system ATP-binding protein